MKKTFIFDVDGVLCDRNHKIDLKFKEWFLDWSQDKTYYIITGSNREKTISQIGEEILLNAQISFHCLGNNIWMQDREVTVNHINLKKEEIDFLNQLINESKFYIKTGNHIEMRKGSINFSIIGKNATQEQRNKYVKYDAHFKERIEIIKHIKQTIPRLEAYIGGDVSVDICLRGANKGQILNLINVAETEINFFGDRCFAYGVDYPVVNSLSKLQHKIFNISLGYKETLKILKYELHRT